MITLQAKRQAVLAVLTSALRSSMTTALAADMIKEVDAFNDTCRALHSPDTHSVDLKLAYIESGFTYTICLRNAAGKVIAGFDMYFDDNMLYLNTVTFDL